MKISNKALFQLYNEREDALDKSGQISIGHYKGHYMTQATEKLSRKHLVF